MLVSVFSDAGLCPYTMASSWGGWARSERGIARSGGILRIESKNTAVVEAAAVVNAAVATFMQGVAWKGDKLLLQTDNTGVHAVLVSGKSRDGNAAKIKELFDAFIAKHSLTYEWRHVKGHKGHASPRNSVNTYCDWVASFYLSVERHRRNPKQYPKLPEKTPYGIAVPPGYEGRIAQGDAP